MRTMNLQEAAVFLGIHKETVRHYAAANIIPGCKPGRSWRFIEEDLAEYMRSLYCNDALQGVKERSKKQWHSSKETTLGGYTSTTKVSGYEKALGLATN
jgi:excisionase family DNA binding protein